MMKLKISKNKNKTCVGKFYRYKIKKYVNKDGAIITEEKIIPMKEASCKGCPDCGYLDEYVREIPEERCPILPINVKNNSVLWLGITNISRCSEFNEIEDFDLEFFEVSEKMKKKAMLDEVKYELKKKRKIKISVEEMKKYIVEGNYNLEDIVYNVLRDGVKKRCDKNGIDI